MTQRLRRRWRRIILIGGVGIALLAITIKVLLAVWLKPLVERKLEELVVSVSDGLYRAQIGRVSLNILTGDLLVRESRIEVDSVRLNALSSEEMPTSTLKASLPFIKAQVRLWPFIFGSTVEMDNVTIRDPDVQILYHPDATAQPFWESMDFKETGASITSLTCENARCSYSVSDTSSAFEWQVDSSNVILAGLGSGLSTLDFELHNLKVISVDSLFIINSDFIEYSSAVDKLEIEHVSCQPSLSREEFYHRTQAQQDLLFFTVEEAQLTGFLLPDLLQHHQVRADTLLLMSPRLEIANDTVAPVGDTALKRYPVRLLADASFGIRVKHALVSHGTINYMEKNPETNSSGRMTFSDLNGSFQNVTNDSLDIAQDSICLVDLACDVMNGARARGVFRLDLGSAADAFEAEITLSAVTPAQLNPLMQPMALMQVQSFALDDFRSTMHGNVHGAVGSVHMLYHDLVLDLSGRKNGLRKLIASRFALWPDNPTRNGSVRSANHVYRSRHPSKSFFNLVWKVMLEGVNHIIMRNRMQGFF